ncbi:MAG TPA: ArsR family transcriptional regulator [Ktedonobacteraceae bacterium]|nr:ArsR family transcriptional regulator [Ktedonobacteraceae bacterium]
MQWNQHFFASTRGRIILLLRRADHTVDELAQSLELTDNAVRAHLATLERDGLVRQSGARRGSGKPAITYNLTAEAEQHFPKAYAPVLHQLLETLSTCLPAEKLEELMKNVGRRLAANWPVPAGDLHTRLQQAVAILNELGGLAELKECTGTYVIQGYSCPLAAVVPGHPEVCQLAQTLLTELTGAPIEEHCTLAGTPRCCFSTAKM